MARFIRGTHHHQFRSGEWAEVLTVAPSPDGKDCFVIRFADGAIDWWLVEGSGDIYEFSDDARVMERV